MCVLCDKKFQTKGGLTKHENSGACLQPNVAGATPVTVDPSKRMCPICGVVVGKKYLNKHISRVHKSEGERESEDEGEGEGESETSSPSHNLRPRAGRC